MYSKLLKFLLILFFLTPIVFVNAQETRRLGLSVSPQIFELDVFPGEIKNEKIIVGNLSKVALPILVRTTDFTAEENSGEMLFDESSQDPSFASRFWFKIENPNLILEPEERREIKFSINVPKNAEPGGHYAVMLFEPQLPSFYFQEGQAQAIPVVGVLFLLSVKTFSLEPEIEQKLEIVEFSIPREQRIIALENFFRVVSRSVSRSLALIAPVYAIQIPEITITEKTPSSFVLRIKNNDIFHHKLSGKLLIYNFFGKRIGEAEIKRTTILPGKIRRFPVNFSSPVPENLKWLKWLPAGVSNFLFQNSSLGNYRVVLEIGEEKSRIELNQTLNFWAFPWKIIFGTLLGLIVLILMRKRIFAVCKVLIKGENNRKKVIHS